MLTHWIWFAQRKLNHRQKRELLEYFHDPEEIYYAGERLFEYAQGLKTPSVESLCDKSLVAAEALVSQCRAMGVRIVPMDDTQYPARLRTIEDPPIVLYMKGKIPDWSAAPAIGVVGTRKASAYGGNVARQFGRQLAACGALVVSGGAAGIDTMALQGAMETERPVVAVLGCGVDVAYPKSNAQLFQKIAETGCLISEYPPGTEPYSWNFPERNRILSGISNGLLVVEAPEKSGALISAMHALEQGKDVYAVPGNLGMASCAGSNALLREGAKAVLSGWDVVREYEGLYPGRVHDEPVPPIRFLQEEPWKEQPATPVHDKKSIDNRSKSTYSVLNAQPADLTEEERTVLAGIDPKGILTDALIDRLEMRPSAVKSILTKLALKQCIVLHPGGRVSLK